MENQSSKIIWPDKMNSKRNIYLGLVVILLLTFCLILINYSNGFSYDSDSYNVVNNARLLTKEGYNRSRTWGFPLYELFVYPTILWLGITWAKIYSLFFCLANIVVFYQVSQVVTDHKKPILSFLITSGFAFLTVTISSGNTILETSQGMFFALLSLLFIIRYWKYQKNIETYLMIICCGLATATRPDYNILSFCLAVVLLLKKAYKAKQILLFIAIFLVFCH